MPRFLAEATEKTSEYKNFIFLPLGMKLMFTSHFDYKNNRKFGLDFSVTAFNLIR